MAYLEESLVLLECLVSSGEGEGRREGVGREEGVGEGGEGGVRSETTKGRGGMKMHQSETISTSGLQRLGSMPKKGRA